MLVSEKEIVAPGEVLAEGMDYLPGINTYRQDNQIYAKVLGLVSLTGRVIKITPLNGPYIPKTKDKIIGRVIDITLNGWRVETFTAYSAMLNVKDATTRYIKKEEDLSKIFAIGDYLVSRIVNVTSQNLIDLALREPGLDKLTGGRVIKINPQKVPRLIGKEGSMVTLIKTKTNCDITIGQNGLVWIKGSTPEMEYLTEQVIKFIEEKAHQSGLTEKVEQFLNQKMGN